MFNVPGLDRRTTLRIKPCQSSVRRWALHSLRGIRGTYTGKTLHLSSWWLLFAGQPVTSQDFSYEQNKPQATLAQCANTNQHPSTRPSPSHLHNCNTPIFFITLLNCPFNLNIYFPKQQSVIDLETLIQSYFQYQKCILYVVL